MFIFQDNTGRNADIVYENVQELCEITDLKWLGVDDDSEDHIANLAYSNVKMKKSYNESVIHEVYCAEMEKVKREMLKEDCTEQFANALQEVYITKVEALELLHLQLGHLPYYQRIERMLQLGVLTGINLDKKLLHQLVRQKCAYASEPRQLIQHILGAYQYLMKHGEGSLPICQQSSTL